MLSRYSETTETLLDVVAKEERKILVESALKSSYDSEKFVPQIVTDYFVTSDNGVVLTFHHDKQFRHNFYIKFPRNYFSKPGIPETTQNHIVSDFFNILYGFIQNYDPNVVDVHFDTTVLKKVNQIMNKIGGRDSLKFSGYFIKEKEKDQLTTIFHIYKKS